MVDLGDPAIAEHHRNARFVARVCTAAETVQIHASDEPKLALWTRFAAKEAAYKVAVKLGFAPGFAHRTFEVAADLASVCYRDIAMELRVAATAQRVHVAAAVGAGPVWWGVARVLATESHGVAVRRLAREAAAERLGCHRDDLDVVRRRVSDSWDGYGPPRLVRGGAAVELDVSLSHDGRFAAFALTQ